MQPGKRRKRRDERSPAGRGAPPGTPTGAPIGWMGSMISTARAPQNLAVARAPRTHDPAACVRAAPARPGWAPATSDLLYPTAAARRAGGASESTSRPVTIPHRPPLAEGSCGTAAKRPGWARASDPTRRRGPQAHASLLLPLRARPGRATAPPPGAYRMAALSTDLTGRRGPAPEAGDERPACPCAHAATHAGAAVRSAMPSARAHEAHLSMCAFCYCVVCSNCFLNPAGIHCSF